MSIIRGVIRGVGEERPSAYAVLIGMILFFASFVILASYGRSVVDDVWCHLVALYGPAEHSRGQRRVSPARLVATGHRCYRRYARPRCQRPKKPKKRRFYQTCMKNAGAKFTSLLTSRRGRRMAIFLVSFLNYFGNRLNCARPLRTRRYLRQHRGRRSKTCNAPCLCPSARNPS